MADEPALHTKSAEDSSDRTASPSAAPPPPPYEQGTADTPSSKKEKFDGGDKAPTDAPGPHHEIEEPPRPDDAEYHDRYITCTPSTLTIRWYYFPGGSKKVPLNSIRGVSRVPIGALTGGSRIWGTSNPTVWAHLDPDRLSKSEALLLHLGSGVRPLITPTDVSALVAVLERHTQIQVETKAHGVLV